MAGGPVEATALGSWLLFGHLAGVAVLAAGVGSYVAGLHQLAAARDERDLHAARPTLRWGEQLSMVGFGLLLATGIGLVVKTSSVAEAWLIVALLLLALVATVGRISGSRLDSVYAGLAAAEPASEGGPDVETLLRQARSLTIHLPADVTVVSILEILYLMVRQPGWWGIVVSLAVGGLLVLGAAWALSREPTVDTAGRAGAVP